jgi:hypothetical protein
MASREAREPARHPFAETRPALPGTGHEALRDRYRHMEMLSAANPGPDGGSNHEMHP